MTERHPRPPSTPPSITTSTSIGPDVNLDADDIRLTDGTRLTEQRAAEVTEEVRHRSGRLALSGEATASPRTAFRVSSVDGETAVDGQRRRDSSSC
ncbi:hypothetical protein GCM10027451_25970 [Geodermatophilus aquaeductus]|uniref:hypothetical protein n=1 Tax=Geodermatophilus aquaeductus TaxID=1564161 RepID=UPI00115BC755|nr:hypothetical protein [Geodermatophilus aquaeductus]